MHTGTIASKNVMATWKHKSRKSAERMVGMKGWDFDARSFARCDGVLKADRSRQMPSGPSLGTRASE